MEFWNTIMHTAILGTDKGSVLPENIPEDLKESYALISQQQTDKEDHYLQLASVALNYKKCGFMPFHQLLDFPLAAPEENSYCSPIATQALNGIVQTDNMPLLRFWLQQCAKANQLLPPERLPLLFDLGMKQKHLQQLVINCAGRRGEWLMKLNEAWTTEADPHDENLWYTGTLVQRTAFLERLRTTNPSGARALLVQSWPQENANTRAEFLKQLFNTVSEDDLPWLELLVTEKSQKVKEEVMKLLKLVPSSSVVQQYWTIIKQAVHIRKEKGLFGIGRKIILDIQLVHPVEESVFKTGIDKLSSQKAISDNDHILYQLMALVPPSFFEAQYLVTMEEIIDTFSQAKQAKQFLSAFGKSAIKFKNKAWVKAITAKTDQELFPEALSILDKRDAENYALRFLNSPDTSEAMFVYLVQYLTSEWTIQLAKLVLTIAASNFYKYPRSFYSNIIMRIPVEVVPELEKCTPAHEDARGAWRKTSEYIIQLLALKTQTGKAFNTTY